MENTTLLVYLWSIYENIVDLFAVITVLSAGTAIIAAVIMTLEDLPYPTFGKTALGVCLCASIISTALPKKEILPYIFAASPVTKAIIESATTEEGKLNKVNKLIDLSLDKALEEVQKSLKDK